MRRTSSTASTLIAMATTNGTGDRPADAGGRLSGQRVAGRLDGRLRMCRSIFGGRSELPIGLRRCGGRSFLAAAFLAGAFFAAGPSLRGRPFSTPPSWLPVFSRPLRARLSSPPSLAREPSSPACGHAADPRARQAAVRWRRGCLRRGSVRGGSGAGSGVSCGRSCGCAIRLLLCRISSRVPRPVESNPSCQGRGGGLAVVGFGRSGFVSHRPQGPAADQDHRAQDEWPDRQFVGRCPGEPVPRGRVCHCPVLSAETTTTRPPRARPPTSPGS